MTTTIFNYRLYDGEIYPYGLDQKNGQWTIIQPLKGTAQNPLNANRFDEILKRYQNTTTLHLESSAYPLLVDQKSNAPKSVTLQLRGEPDDVKNVKFNNEIYFQIVWALYVAQVRFGYAIQAAPDQKFDDDVPFPFSEMIYFVENTEKEKFSVRINDHEFSFVPDHIIQLEVADLMLSSGDEGFNPKAQYELLGLYFRDTQSPYGQMFEALLLSGDRAPQSGVPGSTYGWMGYLFHPYFTSTNIYRGVTNVIDSDSIILNSYEKPLQFQPEKNQNRVETILEERNEAIQDQKLVLCVLNMLDYAEFKDKQVDQEFYDGVDVMNSRCLILLQQYQDDNEEYLITLTQKLGETNVVITPNVAREVEASKGDTSLPFYRQEEKIVIPLSQTGVYGFRKLTWTDSSKADFRSISFQFAQAAYGLLIMLDQESTELNNAFWTDLRENQQDPTWYRTRIQEYWTTTRDGRGLFLRANQENDEAEAARKKEKEAEAAKIEADRKAEETAKAEQEAKAKQEQLAQQQARLDEERKRQQDEAERLRIQEEAERLRKEQEAAAEKERLAKEEADRAQREKEEADREAAEAKALKEKEEKEAKEAAQRYAAQTGRPVLLVDTLKKLRVKELKAILSKTELSQTGNKDDLIVRLQELAEDEVSEFVASIQALEPSQLEEILKKVDPEKYTSYKTDEILARVLQKLAGIPPKTKEEDQDEDEEETDENEGKEEEPEEEDEEGKEGEPEEDEEEPEEEIITLYDIAYNDLRSLLSKTELSSVGEKPVLLGRLKQLSSEDLEEAIGELTLNQLGSILKKLDPDNLDQHKTVETRRPRVLQVLTELIKKYEPVASVVQDFISMLEVVDKMGDFLKVDGIYDNDLVSEHIMSPMIEASEPLLQDYPQLFSPFSSLGLCGSGVGKVFPQLQGNINYQERYFRVLSVAAQLIDDLTHSKPLDVALLERIKAEWPAQHYLKSWDFTPGATNYV